MFVLRYFDIDISLRQIFKIAEANSKYFQDIHHKALYFGEKNTLDLDLSSTDIKIKGHT